MGQTPGGGSPVTVQSPQTFLNAGRSNHFLLSPQLVLSHSPGERRMQSEFGLGFDPGSVPRINLTRSGFHLRRVRRFTEELAGFAERCSEGFLYLVKAGVAAQRSYLRSRAPPRTPCCLGASVPFRPGAQSHTSQAMFTVRLLARRRQGR